VGWDYRNKPSELSMPNGFALKVDCELLSLCAASVFSVSLWLVLVTIFNHRDTEDTEVAQRRLVSGV